MAESPLSTVELLLGRDLPTADEQEVAAFFAQFGPIGRQRRVRAHRGDGTEWLVLAALPLQSFLQNVGTLTGGDAYTAFKSLIARLLPHRSHSSTQEKEIAPIILQDIDSGIRIMIESDLPEIAYRQLHELNLDQFSSGPIHFDRSLGCWRTDERAAT